MWLSRGLFLRELTSIVVVQTFVRRWFSRRLYRSVKAVWLERSCAASKIQQNWRGYYIAARFSRVLSDVLSIQCCYRRWCAARELHRRRYAVSRLQAVARRWIGSLKKRCRAATDIQRSWRGFRIVVRYQLVLADVVTIQCFFRCFVASKEARLRRAMVCRLHDATRQWLYRLHSAVEIQRRWRGFKQARRFDFVKSEVVNIQSLVRRRLAKVKFGERISAVLQLQKSFRRWLAFQRTMLLTLDRQETERIRHCGAIALQRAFRGYVVQRELRSLNSFAVQIQRFYRGFACRIHWQMTLLDIVLAQSAVRVWISRSSACRRLESAVAIQAFARSYLSRKRVQILRTARWEKASTSIQCLWRSFVARGCYKREYAARAIQKTWRCYTVHIDFLLCVLEERAACSIQKTWRCYTVHIDYLLSVLAAIEIQRHFRGFLALRDSLRRQMAVFVIQRFAWRAVDRIRSETVNRSTVTLQSLVRRVLARSRCRRRMTAVISIQRVFRGYVSRLEIEIMRCAACEVIQRLFWRYKARSSFRRLRRGIVLLQSMYRGCKTRLRASRRVKSRLTRVKAANARAVAEPRLRLGCRTRAALHVLRTSKNLSEMMNAVAVLEVATRLSDVCCVEFAGAGAPDMLFSLIRACNRSLPHIELLTCILLTFANVGRHDSLLPSMATITGVEVFLDLVQMFRDKEVVFSLAVSMLERVVRYSEELQVRAPTSSSCSSPGHLLHDLTTVQVFCSSRENMKRLKGVLSLCVRKLSVAGASDAVNGSSSRRGLNSLLEQSTRKSLSGDGTSTWANKGHRLRIRHSFGGEIYGAPKAEQPKLRQGARLLRGVINLLERRSGSLT